MVGGVGIISSTLGYWGVRRLVFWTQERFVNCVGMRPRKFVGGEKF
jgi:hypothetical protein